MSLRRERDEETGKSVLDLLESWYHVPALLAVMGFMLWIRLIPYGRFVRGDTVLFSGNDAWYHYRETSYVVQNWPFTAPFDPWTYFPFGTRVGQFGTLYDQIVATVALILGLGSPSDALVAQVLAVSPAVFGALCAIPVFLIGRRLGGRFAALIGAVILMLLPGTFLQRTMIGVADHNAIEPFFQGMAVFALLVAFAVAEREKPVWELVEDRDWEALRAPTAYAALAGIAVGLYVWVWPPGVMLVAIVGIFVVLKAISDTVAGTSPEPIAYAAAVAMSVTTLMTLLTMETLDPSPTNFSSLQPGMALVVAAGAVFLAWLARLFEERGVEVTYYPVAVLGAIALAVAVASVALPGVTNLVANNVLRIVGFGANAATRTIAEAQPFVGSSMLSRYGVDAAGMIMLEYGMTFFTAAVAVTWLLIRPLVRRGDVREYAYVGGGMVVVGVLFLLPGIHRAVAAAIGFDEQLLGLLVVTALIVGASLLRRYDAVDLFIVVWAAFIAAAAFTQTRFNYYLALVVAVLNAFLIGEILRTLDLRTGASEAVERIEGYQVLVLVAALMLIVTPVLAVPMEVRDGGGGAGQSWTAPQIAASHGPGEISRWEGSFDWMNENTPAVGDYGGAGNADEMDYYGTYDPPSDGDFDYPEGAYGVMSWWDYGHWITARAERIPDANPFQQGAVSAANFLLASDEDEAEAELAARSDEGDRTRYVMVDWQMTEPNEKFSAPIVFYDRTDVSSDEFYWSAYVEAGENRFQPALVVNDQRYYESLMVRLYKYHGSAAEPQPIVVDYETESVQSRQGEEFDIRVLDGDEPVRIFEDVDAAEEYVEEDGSAQIGGVADAPPERVEALEHYRLVKASESSAYQSGSYAQSALTAQQVTGIPFQQQTRTEPAWVKTFERVPGATIEGGGAPEGATVYAEVEMTVPATNETFTYYQRAQADENGDFAFTVPYSTTGYDELGPEEGYTNVSVRAEDDYTIATEPQEDDGSQVRWVANASVTEAQVVGEDESATTVELERDESVPADATPGNETLDEGDGAAAGGGNETADDNETGEGRETAGENETDDNETVAENESDLRAAGGAAVAVTVPDLASAPAERSTVGPPTRVTA